MSPTVWIATVWIASGALAADLEGAAIEIDVGRDVTRVEATYRIAAVGELTFRARRIAGQDLAWLAEEIEIEDRGGLVVFQSAGRTFTVYYELRGKRDRIPLFVPDTVASGAVEIRLHGLEADAFQLRDAFPRLTRAADGSLVAEPANLPSIVRLPPQRGRLSVHRASEAAVLLLVMAATAVWIVRRHGSTAQRSTTHR